jgi:hypothetical protein
MTGRASATRVRTDSAVCVAGRHYVHFELQLVFGDQEIDSAVAGEKIGSSADGQHLSSLNGFAYSSVALTLRQIWERLRETRLLPGIG